VSQVSSVELVKVAAGRGVPFIPGALTPNEIVAAWSLGVQAVKVIRSIDEEPIRRIQ
jgi:2-dehydro-3-deoxyphosphogluconate aldolase/(4S)-4-hydroxy-2-oxoglutarate aldolase